MTWVPVDPQPQGEKLVKEWKRIEEGGIQDGDQCSKLVVHMVAIPRVAVTLP
jgi:hypothetical protein